MTGPNPRSVGELLLDCDLAARRLLIDPDALDAAAMLRAWPELVQAAHELLTALPGPRPDAIPGIELRPVHVDPVGERLHLMTVALHDNLRRRTWPAAGPFDDRLLTMAGHMVRAHDLIQRRLRVAETPSRPKLADEAAARTRVLHTLYMTAHAVGLATRQEARALRSGDHAARTSFAMTKRAALNLVATRIDNFEQLAGPEVYRSFPAALHGRHKQAQAPNALGDALALWEVETRRAMVNDPSLGNIVELTRVQSATIALTHTLLEGASHAGTINAQAYRDHVAPRLTAAASAWGDLQAIARDLTTTDHRDAARDLRAAGSGLIRSLTDLALDGTSVASSASIAERVTSPDVPATLLRALQTHHDASQILLDAVLDPRIHVNAKAAQYVITSLMTSPQSPSPDEPWVSPRDIANGRQIQLPAPVRGALQRRVHEVHKTSGLVATGAADLIVSISAVVGRPCTINEYRVVPNYHHAVTTPPTNAPRLAR